MTGDGSWFNFLMRMAIPVIFAIVYFTRAKRNSESSAGIKMAVLNSKYDDVRPARWFHHLAVVMFCSTPFVQFFWYVKSRHWAAVIIPLIFLMIVLMVIGTFSPRVTHRPKPATQGARPVAFIAVCLWVAFVMPKSGTLLVMQGALIDILGLLLVAIAMGFLRSRKMNSVSA